MADDTLKCPACGGNLPAGAQTCPFCGAVVPARDAAGAPAAPASDLPFSPEFFEHDKAVHPHAAHAAKHREHRVEEQVRRIAADPEQRRRVKTGLIVAAAVLGVVLVAAVAIALVSDAQLRARAQQGAAELQDDVVDVASLADTPFGGGFAASDGESLYWASDTGIYALDAEALADADRSARCVLDGVDAVDLYAYEDGLVYRDDDGSIWLLSDAQDAEPRALLSASDNKAAAGLVVHDSVAIVALRDPSTADDEEESDGKAAGKPSVTVACIDLAQLGDKAPAWNEVYSLASSRAWLFDTGDTVAVLAADARSWSLAEVPFDGIPRDGVSDAAFAEIMMGDETIEAAWFDGEELYKTVSEKGGGQHTSRQEPGGTFNDYTGIQGLPLVAGSPSTCVFITGSGGFAWVDSGAGFLHDETAALDDAQVSVSATTSRVTVCGERAYLLTDIADGSGTLNVIDLSSDPVSVIEVAARS